MRLAGNAVDFPIYKYSLLTPGDWNDIICLLEREGVNSVNLIILGFIQFALFFHLPESQLDLVIIFGWWRYF